MALTKRGREPGWFLISEPLDQRNNTDPVSKSFFFFSPLQSGFDYLGELNLKRRNKHGAGRGSYQTFPKQERHPPSLLERAANVSESGAEQIAADLMQADVSS